MVLKARSFVVLYDLKLLSHPYKRSYVLAQPLFLTLFVLIPLSFHRKCSWLATVS